MPDMSKAPSDLMMSMNSMTGLEAEHNPLMATDFMFGDKADAALPHFEREPQDEVSMGLPHFKTHWDAGQGSVIVDLACPGKLASLRHYNPALPFCQVLALPDSVSGITCW